MKKVYEFAGIAVEAVYSHSYLERQCADYESCKAPDINVEITRADIEYERRHSDAPDAFSDGYLESLAFYRAFVTLALDYDVLLLHGSAISYLGYGYIYSAASGTGKSTHARLCKEVFGDDVQYINDDKPLLRRLGGEWYVFGTPWDGKHHLSENRCVPLGGICELARGETNEIHPANADAALRTLLRQVYRPDDEDRMKKTLDLAVSLAEIRFWQMKCNISRDAAVMSLGEMGGKR